MEGHFEYLGRQAGIDWASLEDAGVKGSRGGGSQAIRGRSNERGWCQLCVPRTTVWKQDGFTRWTQAHGSMASSWHIADTQIWGRQIGLCVLNVQSKLD